MARFFLSVCFFLTVVSAFGSDIQFYQETTVTGTIVEVNTKGQSWYVLQLKAPVTGTDYYRSGGETKSIRFGPTNIVAFVLTTDQARDAIGKFLNVSVKLRGQYAPQPSGHYPTPIVLLLSPDSLTSLEQHSPAQ